MNEHIRTSNIERFTGFSDLYNQNRPSAPQEVVKILTTYLQKRPQRIMDVGCGTGLSSFIWLDHADHITGVEPSDDMRAVALKRWQEQNEPSQLKFVEGLSHQLDAPSESVDIITCSQSFHWMEPESTLKEFARVLRPGGIFAAYDCDWPPAFNWEIEERYKQLIALADSRARQLAEQDKQAHKWNKSEHLQHIRESGLFRFSKEIVFHNWETCDATRYANIALSQGGLQTALKLGANELSSLFEDFRKEVENTFAGETREILFSYRMRMGIK
ncbi:ubiquinone/menaquinone biosynthesis C-methylase UbiE [Pullulanibacillus pueri]|uniref:Methyltransferase type 11 domain-containing protein n=2 Tax=Pullulanibacillus pueri TaxID=1437324 RepID=A0A8J2ZUP9_9BACL|nr:ubiquinone/menaquinone biosynthesis C-methylase UbiE [Pullulanibacillus pueri]GGH77791.1 hypothetical protein GCM10007096_10210 [Pullulanibacillus pueri]